MASVNRVIIIGNLGADPEIKVMPNGGKIARLNVATSESWKDKTTGEKKERTEWHRVSVMNENLASVCERFLHKGSKVYLEGQLETRKWQDKDTGADRYSTEIVLRQFNGEIVMLDSKGGDNEQAQPQTPKTTGADYKKAQAGWPAQNTAANPFEDDSIPF